MEYNWIKLKALFEVEMNNIKYNSYVFIIHQSHLYTTT